LNDQPDRQPRVLPRLEDFPYRYVEAIRYADMDRQGHVNNAVYSTFFESGRVNVFRDPSSGLDIPDVDTGVVRLEIDFLRELQWPGTVVVGTAVARIGRTSFVLNQAVFKDGVCAATARAVMVLMDPATRRPRPIPEQAIVKLKMQMR
jgi:acyl-CoA thioester hydrolase